MQEQFLLDRKSMNFIEYFFCRELREHILRKYRRI